MRRDGPCDERGARTAIGPAAASSPPFQAEERKQARPELEEVASARAEAPGRGGHVVDRSPAAAAEAVPALVGGRVDVQARRPVIVERAPQLARASRLDAKEDARV